jgi:hypothetical protein
MQGLTKFIHLEIWSGAGQMTFKMNNVSCAKKQKHHFRANQKTNFPLKSVFWLHELHFMQIKQDFLTAG